MSQMALPTAASSAVYGAASVLEVRGYGYTYPGRSAPALADISFELRAGSCTLLVGRTGSGKSTLLRGICGLLTAAGGAARGEVLVDGLRINRAAAADRARRVGLVLQSPDDQICCGTVSAEVAFGLCNLGLKPEDIASRVEQALAQVGLADRSQEPTHSLSGGLKQRLVLASILAMRPRLLLLDEPLSQLDALAAGELLAALDAARQQGLAILIAEHRLEEVLPWADRLLSLDGGRLVADVHVCADGRWAAALDAAGLPAPSLVKLARQLAAPPARHAEELLAALPAERRNLTPPLPRTRSADDAFAAAPTNAIPAHAACAHELAYAFRRDGPAVLQGVTFSINAGERVALVGPNASGKSTLLALLAGLITPTAGSLECPASPVALVPQNPDLGLIGATVADELRLGPLLRGATVAEANRCASELAQQLGLAAHLTSPPHALSQGQRLRVAVAAALAVRPRLLLLDEPTLGQETACTMLACLCSPGGLISAQTALVLATHDLEVAARFADRVLVLHQGRLIADLHIAALLDDAALLSKACLRLPDVWRACRLLGLDAEAALSWLRASAVGTSPDAGESHVPAGSCT